MAWRYSNYDTPFWVRANTRAGRWNAAREDAVQYLTFDPDAAWAELIRAENLRSERDVEYVRMPIWVARVDEKNLVDYSTFDQAEAAGFPPDALIDDDWGRCQREGTRLREGGYAGVVCPSAALPGATNVTLFGARIVWRWTRPPGHARAVSAKSYQERVLGAGLPEADAEMRALARSGQARGWLLFLDGRPVSYLWGPAEGETLIFAHLG